MNKATLILAVGMTAAVLVRGDEIKHRFLVSDFMHHAVHFVDQTDASKNWTLTLPELTMDLQLVGKNRLLCNRSKGYDVYDLSTREKVESFQCDEIKDTVRTVRRLASSFLESQGPMKTTRLPGCCFLIIRAVMTMGVRFLLAVKMLAMAWPTPAAECWLTKLALCVAWA